MAVVGGGQLARMMQEEASALGVHLRALVEAPDGSAAAVIPDAPVGAAGDEAAVRALLAGRPGSADPLWAGAAQVLTFEHEHQDAALLERLQAEGISVQPSAQALELARDKLAMRRAMSAAGLPQPAWAELSGSAEQMRAAVLAFAQDHGWPVVLKTPRGGYDGHGVLLVHEAAELEAGEAAQWLKATAAARAGQASGGAGAEQPAGGGGSLGGGAVSSLLVEEAIPFTRELAVLLARSPSGELRAWPVAQTRQVDGICAQVVAPAPGLDAQAVARAQAVGRQVAESFGVTGVLAVEIFAVERASEPVALYINELAMRPHNSGHWTQDGAVTSQFAQHLRAVLDLPLGSTAPVAPATVMVNLLGGVQEPGPQALRQALALEPEAQVHLYGKGWRTGRKLGHVNLRVPGPAGSEPTPQAVQETLERACAVVAILRGESPELGENAPRPAAFSIESGKS
ncbi:N5-carboxyaminoimidazole ribonucleotide synthase [Actinomyces bovis]|uniref:N5-carboxyaminoimidazole ribonucleotide synthase n=1 Tax=Actinomyces bovis TaxID=1658 RepID=A0ABY1VNK6_9ACTO|nr:N5-carboxyaminoimidazole ribonucleotide synthase [Actinomyces bovis]VEG52578.1 N5-carboxyaminoimidazole ribonucleotide synthase [Actinomyces israelii]